MSAPKTLTILTVFVGLLLAACMPLPPTPAPGPGMPNPASVYCEEQGGKVELRTDASGGMVGFCVFPDGSECEEWAYYRGECRLPGSVTDPLAGTTWVLADLGSEAVRSDTQITIRFEDGRLGGADGCNRYSTAYKADGVNLNVDKNVVSTMMACPEPIMQQASAYIAALTQAATYKVEGGQLMLFDAAGKTLATFAQQNTSLAGTSWLVTGYNNGREAVVSTIAGTELTADFGADGTLSGSAGCNRYTATYEVSGTNLKIGPAASTRMACADPAGVMEQETQFLQALATAATYRLDGDRLELRTADGALAVNLIAR